MKTCVPDTVVLIWSSYNVGGDLVETVLFTESSQILADGVVMALFSVDGQEFTCFVHVAGRASIVSQSISTANSPLEQKCIYRAWIHAFGFLLAVVYALNVVRRSLENPHADMPGNQNLVLNANKTLEELELTIKVLLVLEHIRLPREHGFGGLVG